MGAAALPDRRPAAARRDLAGPAVGQVADQAEAREADQGAVDPAADQAEDPEDEAGVHHAPASSPARPYLGDRAARSRRLRSAATG